MTLTEFLLARIAEDEARARAAIEDDGGSDEGFSGQYAALVTPPSGVGIAQGGFGEAAARMIATYAVPARVLAGCERDRQIVEEHPLDDDGYCYDSTTHSRGCKWLWPCPTLRILALPYADHPDYREEWKP